MDGHGLTIRILYMKKVAADGRARRSDFHLFSHPIRALSGHTGHVELIPESPVVYAADEPGFIRFGQKKTHGVNLTESVFQFRETVERKQAGQNRELGVAANRLSQLRSDLAVCLIVY
ncbi:hypothetical protein [Desulfovibrio sp. Huiquan2017]|uniref:hypothetical protein n=1 Tax=Desulfovibrio sp. Huiquan2017 TaxID=2816861 RepID=UPI00256FEA0F|nr:hypothetical protein [Desulfovibrio sp. Huiquan2017]